MWSINSEGGKAINIRVLMCVRVIRVSRGWQHKRVGHVIFFFCLDHVIFLAAFWRTPVLDFKLLLCSLLPARSSESVCWLSPQKTHWTWILPLFFHRARSSVYLCPLIYALFSRNSIVHHLLDYLPDLVQLVPPVLTTQALGSYDNEMLPCHPTPIGLMYGRAQVRRVACCVSRHLGEGKELLLFWPTFGLSLS